MSDKLPILTEREMLAVKNISERLMMNPALIDEISENIHKKFAELNLSPEEVENIQNWVEYVIQNADGPTEW